MRRELAGGIGGRIARARKERGLTQEELAALVGVSPRSVQGYEAGKVVPYRRLGRIAEVTERDLRWLLEGDPASATSVEPEVLEQLTQLMEEVAAEARRIRALAEHLEALLDDAGGRAGQIPAA